MEDSRNVSPSPDFICRRAGLRRWGALYLTGSTSCHPPIGVVTLEIKLAKQRVPVYAACGTRLGEYRRDAVQALFDVGRVARAVRRKDAAISRVYLLAMPNEIASRITAQATVVKVLPTTYTHRSSLMAGF